MENRNIREREELHKAIWSIADDLRGSVDGWDFKQYILGIMFYRYISENMTNYINEGERKAGDDNFDYAKLSDEEAETIRKEMVNEKGFFILPSELFANVCKKAKDDENLNETLERIFNNIENSAKGAESEEDFAGLFDDIDVNSNKLGATVAKRNDKLVKILDGIANIPLGNYKDNSIDAFGDAYEFLMSMYASNAGKSGGEFYTPHDVVQLIATMIEPYDGTLYDPCCGSGGMFIQSAELVKSKQGNLNGINVYGQEKEPATYRLAKMNLALRGISHNLGEEADSSFTHDLHKGLHFNYIMANPPFNLKGWYNDNLKNDGRWSDYQTPPESNANYAWILHILSHLKKTDGVAGFLLANGALNDSDTLEIRKELIQNDKIEAIVVLPRELFITTDISVTLWILNQNKKGGKYHGRNLRNREHEILFMDLRQWTENAVKGESKKKVRLDTEQIEKAADIYHTWQCEGIDGTNYEIPELYRSVGIDEIENKGWALTPSKYIEFIDHDLEIDYEKEMVRIQSEMQEVMKQEKKSQQMLEEAFRGIGYGID